MERTWYIEAESAKPIFWTDDGIDFCLASGEETFARRENDELMLIDGGVLARVSDDARVLLDPTDGFPVAVEQNFYQTMVNSWPRA